MPVVVRFEDPDLFYNDSSPAHMILERNGIQRGEYRVLSEMPPIIILPQLDDAAIGELKSLGQVEVEVHN
ncbi:hypothetical protein BDV27DRAFT_131511 [Aspergillus caelatus]|uniref:Uncharacterized protein n=1 Tax=Aspergillus caelatus TaxID=61420 RepID=A0A5N6ZYI2_9EURO|nr:uncharacterized protein BDV27DRAFT_131511 [Aspergillus caelatus]KAE8362418.1 hypothetical protein BDV27DRAFT_131511 [Aspergillus caelatus]